jgi:hypothetical protein
MMMMMTTTTTTTMMMPVSLISKCRYLTQSIDKTHLSNLILLGCFVTAVAAKTVSLHTKFSHVFRDLTSVFVGPATERSGAEVFRVIYRTCDVVALSDQVRPCTWTKKQPNSIIQHGY